MGIPEIVTYLVTFFALYVQLFLLVTFLERRRELSKEVPTSVALSRFPTVAVIVPCWNESKTLVGTVDSILALEYPKNRLSVVVVDDGSTDDTWQVMQEYQQNPQVRLYRKENGGKHTAVNFGIEHTDAEFVGCLDADSFVAPDALVRILEVFEQKPDVMAVSPSIIIHRPKNFLQAIQRVEYNMSLYIKKMLSFLNALHVVPGPFSIFRRRVFDRIGLFRAAHNTEDAEIAFRMQQHHLKIDHCHTARVYTVAPETIGKLFRQRLRWTYGFIQNALDYRRILLRRRYGNFSLFTVPSGFISIAAVIYIFLMLLYRLGSLAVEKYVQVQTVGVASSFHGFRFDWFYFDTKMIVFVSIAIYSFLLFAIIRGHQLAREERRFHGYIIPYMLAYSVLAPLWLIRAAYNTILAKRPSWR